VINKILPTVDFTPSAPPELKGYALMIRKLYEQLARVLNQVVDVINGGTAGAVLSVFGRVGAVVAVAGDYVVAQITGAAPLASPAFTGTPTAPTRAALDNSTKIATTAYADSAVGVETTRATTAEALLAPKASPTFTGVPAAPTAGAGTNTTQLASTAFVTAAVAAAVTGVSSVFGRTGAVVAKATDYFTTRGKWAHLVADGATTALQFLGERAPLVSFVGGGVGANAPSSTSGPSIGGNASIGNVGTWYGQDKNYWVGRNIRGLFIGPAFFRTTDCRLWFGFTDQTGLVQGAGDNPAGNYAAFRFSSVAGDSFWQPITKDGSSQTIGTLLANVGVTTWHRFAIIMDDSVPNVSFYADGVLVSTITTHLPTAGTAVRWCITEETIVSNAGAGVSVESVYIETDF
jgi:hypothetical protein